VFTKFSNKYALITGASTGIGRETAIELSKKGYELGLIGRNLEKLEETKKLIGGGSDTDIFVADLADLNSVKKSADTILKNNKKIDLIANIAGIWHGKDEVFAGVDYEKFDDSTIINTMNVGIMAPMLLVKNLLNLMNPESIIVNLSGTFENGGKGWLPYFVSKRAIEDFTVGLADELKEKEIMVVGVSPSDTATESYKKFFLEFIDDSQDPKDIAKFIANLNYDIKESGKIFVMKKDQRVFESFHY